MFSTTSALLNRGLLCEDETMFVHTLHAKKLAASGRLMHGHAFLTDISARLLQGK